MWKRCVALHATGALRGAGAYVMRDTRGQRTAIVAAGTSWASLPHPPAAVPQRTPGAERRHRHLAMAMHSSLHLNQ
ncbi:hypothetical protein XAP6164_3750019 [Xanthomonas phaseoli pv. phaseoli]|nr:hypothetical protein XAP6164_3750019 [Xanthomonas phaseoli pv. phaseoli]